MFSLWISCVNYLADTMGLQYQETLTIKKQAPCNVSCFDDEPCKESVSINEHVTNY